MSPGTERRRTAVATRKLSEQGAIVEGPVTSNERFAVHAPPADHASTARPGTPPKKMPDTSTFVSTTTFTALSAPS
jgi:hypothetical protein